MRNLRDDRHEEGQSLIEGALLLPLYILLFLALWAFGEWFLIRQQLIMVVREGALLYSSGRMNVSDVKVTMRNAWVNGHPSLVVSDSDIFVGRNDDRKIFELDRVSVAYKPAQTVLNLVRTVLRLPVQQMEESCVIKHAPPYWGILGINLTNLGPPISW